MVIKDNGIFINIKGVNNTTKAIEKINGEVEKQLAIQMEKVVALVGNSAKGNAHVLTGFMKANIKGSILRRRSVISGIVRSRAPYSIYEEFKPGHEFMRPALTRNKQRIYELLGQAVMDGSMQATKKYTVNTERLF